MKTNLNIQTFKNITKLESCIFDDKSSESII